jgi:hypothetical protein
LRDESGGSRVEGCGLREMVVVRCCGVMDWELLDGVFRKSRVWVWGDCRKVLFDSWLGDFLDWYRRMERSARGILFCALVLWTIEGLMWPGLPAGNCPISLRPWAVSVGTVPLRLRGTVPFLCPRATKIGTVPCGAVRTLRT